MKPVYISKFSMRNKAHANGSSLEQPTERRFGNDIQNSAVS